MTDFATVYLAHDLRHDRPVALKLLWRNADPELQPYVTEAREGRARPTAERK